MDQHVHMCLSSSSSSLHNLFPSPYRKRKLRKISTLALVYSSVDIHSETLNFLARSTSTLTWTMTTLDWSSTTTTTRGLCLWLGREAPMRPIGCGDPPTQSPRQASRSESWTPLMVHTVEASRVLSGAQTDSREIR